MNNIKNNSIKNLIAILVFAVLILFSCTKKNNITWVYYQETYCTDAWNYSSNNETLKNNLTDYFKSKDIKVYDMEIFIQSEGDTSKACANKTGRLFHCKIPKSDLQKIKSYGFYE